MPTTAPPLLLTKRLTTFLTANLSPQLSSALLCTPSGKLLSYASPIPVSALRTHCTVSAALYLQHAATATAVSAALPSAPSSTSAAPTCITVSLADGSLVIRRLSCGLLFVCIGPSAAEGGGRRGADEGAETPAVAASPSEEGSVAASYATSGGGGAADMAALGVLRKHAEGLAQWLDEKLGALKEPEEGIGIGVGVS